MTDKKELVEAMRKNKEIDFLRGRLNIYFEEGMCDSRFSNTLPTITCSFDELVNLVELFDPNHMDDWVLCYVFTRGIFDISDTNSLENVIEHLLNFANDQAVSYSETIRELHETTEERDEFTDIITNLEKDNEELQGQISSLEDEVGKVESDLEEANSELIQLEAELNAVNREIEELESSQHF